MPCRRSALASAHGPLPASLCLDTADPASDIATFWAAVSGGPSTPATTGGPPDVVGRAEQHEHLLSVPVPEPKTVKNRVHLDVYAAAIDDLTALGAEVGAARRGERLRTGPSMRDPEGNEFCAFLRGRAAGLPHPRRRHRLRGPGARSPPGGATSLGAEVSDNAEHGGGWWTLLGATDDPVLTWTSCPSPSPRRSRTASTGTSAARRGVPRPRRDPPAGTVPAGPSWPTPRATSSASSRRSDALGSVVSLVTAFDLTADLAPP